MYIIFTSLYNKKKNLKEIYHITSDCDLFCVDTDHESHEDAITTEITEELQPAKVPLHPKDIVSSKKVHALRKEQKRKLGKQRSMGSPMDYSPLPIDKHEPEFVSVRPQLF